MVTKEQIQSVADKIAKEFQPEKIILFGSYAWGKPTEDSDVDFMVIKDVPDIHECAMKIHKALWESKFPMDVLVRTPQAVEKKIREDRNLFLEDIVKNGTPLYVHN